MRRGVLDLTVKEFVVAFDILRKHVDGAVADCWRKALAGLPPDATYISKGMLEEGKRLNNYAASASVCEWLRYRCGLADEREWIERHLRLSMPLFNALGMFRDPGDPMLYDLMVRQNLSELMHHGYDGACSRRIEEMLRRAGLATLLMLSPHGYAPFGGRSNSLLHNEGMAAFVCEHQANAYFAGGRIEMAAAFREAAHRAARAAAPFAMRVPSRNIKNLFDPSTRHGKDSSYGEYANYGLLGASLFARTGLLANDEIPAARAPAASRGSVLNLWPGFHKTFATCGDTHVEIDTRRQAAYDATGLGRFMRKDAPPEIALSMGLPKDPKHVVYEALSDREVALGPCWRNCAGQWQALARMGREIEHVSFSKTRASAEAVEWSLTWSFDSGESLPVASLTQRYRLTGGRLDIGVSARGVFEHLGFEVPCLVTDGETEAEIDLSDGGVIVKHKGWKYTVELPGACAHVLETEIRANRNAHYRVARFEFENPSIEARLSIGR